MLLPENYVSNTLASNGNQTFFEANENEIQTGLVFIKVYKGGSYKYRFAYSGIIDTTFADGSESKCNDICPEWKIHSLDVAVTDSCKAENADKLQFLPLTFSGKKSVTVDGDKVILTDDAEINADKGSFICLKMTFSGKKIPCHKESIIASFVKQNNEYILSPLLPFPVFTGVKRNTRLKIAFIGDSITQGIGTEFNSYKHYASLVAENLSDEYAFWDLGIGFARGSDAASDGIWLEKAKENDIVSVCFGVNDIFKGHSENEIKKDIETIVSKLKESGSSVILQTVPPFDYDEKYAEIWQNVNHFIKTELVKKADFIFDNVPVLSKNGLDSPASKYGSHPNNDGNAVWAEKLTPVIKEICEKREAQP